MSTSLVTGMELNTDISDKQTKSNIEIIEQLLLEKKKKKSFNHSFFTTHTS